MGAESQAHITLSRSAGGIAAKGSDRTRGRSSRWSAWAAPTTGLCGERSVMRGAIDWLPACPGKGFFTPIESGSTGATDRAVSRKGQLEKALPRECRRMKYRSDRAARILARW